MAKIAQPTEKTLHQKSWLLTFLLEETKISNRNSVFSSRDYTPRNFRKKQPPAQRAIKKPKQANAELALIRNANAGGER